MTLRNAFANLVTESLSGTIETLVTSIDTRLAALQQVQARQAIMEQPRDLQYARTASDQMRVNVDNVPLSITAQPANNGTSGMNAQSLPWFGAGAVFIVDEREQQRIQTEQQFNQVRTQRWVIT